MERRDFILFTAVIPMSVQATGTQQAINKYLLQERMCARKWDLWRKCFVYHTKKFGLDSLSDKPPWGSLMNDQLCILDHSGCRMKEGLKNNAKNRLENMVEDGMRNKMEVGERKTT